MKPPLNPLPPLSDEFLSRLRESITDPSAGYSTLGIVMHQLIDELTGLRRMQPELKRHLESALTSIAEQHAEIQRLKGEA